MEIRRLLEPVRRRCKISLTLADFFCGAGGSSQGAASVPGVSVKLAANHWKLAIETHGANFPDAEHVCADLHDVDVTKLPGADIFWASPECPAWSQARGRQRDFDKEPDPDGETLPDEAADRSRSLMWDVPRYLEAMTAHGNPVLAGVVENVPDVRAWWQWDSWTASIRNQGYRTRLVALNSMHARPAVTVMAPQSRDRLYFCYWRESLGRDPDWDRWLRPEAPCDSCGTVPAEQAWKQPGRDMGRYRQQYLYRCVHCKRAVDPPASPAAAAIDWNLKGTRIGDRRTPLSEKTLRRISEGLRRFSLPLLVPAGGTWRNDALPVTAPMPARTTRENDGVATTPDLDGHLADLLVPYYSTGVARPVSEPVGTITAVDRYALAQSALDISDVLFRMLAPHEIAAAMAFAPAYKVFGSKREKVRQLGNAVTPPVAEVLVSALVESITGNNIPSSPGLLAGIPA